MNANFNGEMIVFFLKHVELPGISFQLKNAVGCLGYDQGVATYIKGGNFAQGYITIID
jgi:hypothetical protein